MPYADHSPKAREWAEAAHNEMRRQRISPHPVNYSLWYSYAADRFPDLTAELRGRLESGEPFTETFGRALFDRHFCLDRQGAEVLEVGAQLNGAVARLMRILSEAGADTNKHSDNLVALQDELSDKLESGDVGTVIQRLIAEAERMVVHSRSLNDRLTESAQQIDDLRANLQAVQQEALTDPLTGLANRKCFERELANRIEQNRSTSEPLSLLLVDIDHFKRFNDTYGHQIGDQVLQVVAKVLKSGIKGQDVAARLGGEEFCVILPQTELRNAVAVAESLRATLQARALVHRKTGRNFGSVTISVGAARCNTSDTVDSLVHRADEALYAAKASGRNCVVPERDAPADSRRAG